MEEGGLDADGATSRWERTIASLVAWKPDVACLQEMSARRDSHKLRKHLWATANALGMVPILGSEGGVSGNHPAIMVSAARLIVPDEGPPPRAVGHDPAWCEALLRVRPAGPVIRAYSVHLPPRSAAAQLIQAQRLATSTAQRGELGVVCGDWNCYARGDQLTADILASMPPHLRPARMRVGLGKELTANYDVHDALTAVGLIDVAAGLPPSCRLPHELTPTGINGGGRGDRFYVTGEVWESGAVESYAQKDGGGSDHHMALITIRLDKLAAAVAPGFCP